MDYGKLTHHKVDEEICKLIVILQKARCRDTTSLTDEEVVEEGLWRLLKAREDIEYLVKAIDPDRFAPIRTTSIESQDLNRRRLNTCNICGHTRCTSDHK